MKNPVTRKAWDRAKKMLADPEFDDRVLFEGYRRAEKLLDKPFREILSMLVRCSGGKRR